MTEHDGFAAIEMLGASTRMIIVTGTGPRIAWFGFRDGDNFLYWDTDRVHRRGDWELLGGHRLWVTRPGADESAEIYVRESACSVLPIDEGVAIVAPPNASGIEKTVAITVRDDVWRIEHRLRNAGELLWSGGAWALTCTLPHHNTVYRIPLGGGTPTWDVTTIVIPTRWGGGHTSRLDDPQFALTSDAMVIAASGLEGKRMMMAPLGQLEMIDPARGVFAKRATYFSEATYPLATNLAVYVGPERFMVELETMSPLRTLAPGAMLSHVESWELHRPAR